MPKPIPPKAAHGSSTDAKPDDASLDDVVRILRKLKKDRLKTKSSLSGRSLAVQSRRLKSFLDDLDASAGPPKRETYQEALRRIREEDDDV